MTKRNEPDREAARYRPLSSKESRDANCLRFNSHDDALDFARKSVQDSKNWLSAHNVSFADEYVKGYAEVHVKIPSFGYPGKLKLVAQVSHLVYPKDISGIHSDIHRSIPIVNNPVFAEGNEVHDSLVFCGTSEARGTPKKAIPSVVWLECFYEFGDLKGDAFTSSLDLPVDFIPILGEWKLKNQFRGHYTN